MKQPMEKIYTGYNRRKSWEFTGDWKEVGSQENDSILYIPIYKSNNEELLLSMTQSRREKPAPG